MLTDFEIRAEEQTVLPRHATWSATLIHPVCSLLFPPEVLGALVCVMPAGEVHLLG